MCVSPIRLPIVSPNIRYIHTSYAQPHISVYLTGQSLLENDYPCGQGHLFSSPIDITKLLRGVGIQFLKRRAVMIALVVLYLVYIIPLCAYTHPFRLIFVIEFFCLTLPWRLFRLLVLLLVPPPKISN